MPPTDSRPSAAGPRLLVSVRSESEARAAIAGGADILDVKDPDRGSLGCPDPIVIQAVCQAASTAGIQVTTALGEASQWADGDPFAVPPAVSFAKLGLAALGGRSRWVQEWLAVRRRFDSQATGIEWVAVAYVDESPARSPHIDDVATAAIETRCAGLLLDTCVKSAGRLFDSISEQKLTQLADRMHAEGKFIAAAGRLRLDDLARLSALPVDIVAVRSAACAHGDRRSVVSKELVIACKAALEARDRRLSDAC